MATEILDFRTDGVFWTTKDGGKLKQFALDLYPKIPSETHLSLTKASEILFFTAEAVGANTLRAWNESNLLVLTQQQPLAISRRELVVAQLLKVIFAENEQKYQSVRERTKNNLSDSGLEIHIGDQLKSNYNDKVGAVSLTIPDDPWFYYLMPLSIKRTRARRN